MSTPSRLLPVLVASCAAISASAAAHPAVAAPSQPATRAIERSLLTRVNHIRRQHRLAPLARARPLERAARVHSAWLSENGLLIHEGPGGAPFWTRLVAAGYPRGRRMAENLADIEGCGAAPARRTVAAWLASAPHRANLLDPRLRAAGFGVARSADCRIVVTADFGG